MGLSSQMAAPPSKMALGDGLMMVLEHPPQEKNEEIFCFWTCIVHLFPYCCATCIYSLIAFDERVTFWLQRVPSLLWRVRMLHYLRVGSRITITQSHTHTMQQTHTHKAVTGRVETKKLLSRQRQSDYSVICLDIKINLNSG